MDLIPSNDFSLYDHMLDTIAMVGAVPERFGWSDAVVTLPTYFAMARGRAGHAQAEGDVCCGSHDGEAHAMEMTKWFDTNYHYIVPEFSPGQTFRLASCKAVEEFQDALEMGIKTKPVLVGPFTFLKLGKVTVEKFNRYELLPALTEVYIELLQRLVSAKAEWVQFDEPAFALDLTREERELLTETYKRIVAAVPSLKIIVATYFGELRENLATFTGLPVHALHLDVTRSGREFETVLKQTDKVISLGLVDGRNIWRNDYRASLRSSKRRCARSAKSGCCWRRRARCCMRRFRCGSSKSSISN